MMEIKGSAGSATQHHTTTERHEELRPYTTALLLSVYLKRVIETATQISENFCTDSIIHILDLWYSGTSVCGANMSVWP